MAETANYGWPVPEDGDGQQNGKPWGASYREFLEDVDGKLLAWRNQWDPATSYAANSLVSRNGAIYIALQASTGQDPATATDYWGVMAEKGSGTLVCDYASLPATADEGTVAYVTDAIRMVGLPYQCVGGHSSQTWTPVPRFAPVGASLIHHSWEGVYKLAHGENIQNEFIHGEDGGVSTRRATVATSAAGVGPDLETLLCVTEDMSLGNHAVVADIDTWYSTAGVKYVVSFVAKAGTCKKGMLQLRGPAFADATLFFDASTGEFNATGACTGEARRCANGAWRFAAIATAVVSDGNAATFSLFMADDSYNLTYTGSGRTLYCGHFEIKRGTSMTRFLTTIGSVEGSTVSIQANGQVVYAGRGQEVGNILYWGKSGVLATFSGGAWVRASDGLPIEKMP